MDEMGGEKMLKAKIKKIIKEELQKFFKSSSPNVYINSKKGNFLVYYYNRQDPKGGDWYRSGNLPGKHDIKGSIDSAKAYVSFILDYGQIMADIENEKAGAMKYKPIDFTYDTVLAIDTRNGDIFGPVNNPATENDPKAGVATRRDRGLKKPETKSGEQSDPQDTHAERPASRKQKS